MKPRGALTRKPLRGRDGVATLDCHALSPPLRETDDAALEDVDGRVDGVMIAR